MPGIATRHRLELGEAEVGRTGGERETQGVEEQSFIIWLEAKPAVITIARVNEIATLEAPCSLGSAEKAES